MNGKISKTQVAGAWCGFLLVTVVPWTIIVVVLAWAAERWPW